jgi:hypothetical protein
MIYYKNDKIKSKFLSMCDEKDLKNPLKIRDILKNSNISFGRINMNKDGGTEIALNQDYVFIDDMGEIQIGKGKYTKFLDLESGVTELEDVMSKDIRRIIQKNLDILYLGE